MVSIAPSGRKLITLIPGDGIGPEVISAAKRVIEATDASIEWEEREAGASVFKGGLASGVPDETIASIRKTGVVFKGPLETPVGYGEKSANVTLRTLFETYGNIRPVRELPGIVTPYQGRGIDLVIVRENVEDLYTGIEYMQTPGVAECLKLISRKGCEKIIRLAFELAVAEGRRKVHCATKANIMKLTEGMMKRTFEEVAKDYPYIAAEHMIVDNCAHQLVRRPEQFDVIVTTNMNGDILSDLASGLTGGLGFAPSANLGSTIAMFEAVHGSAPDIAGKNLANPTAVLLAAVMMLRHLGEFEAASCIENAILITLEGGKALTADVAISAARATTSDFADMVIGNLGRPFEKGLPRSYQPLKLPQGSTPPDRVHVTKRRVTGVDLFVESEQRAEEIGRNLESLCAETPVRLLIIANRGIVAYPLNQLETDPVDHWRCRFVLRDGNGDLSDKVLLDLVQRVGAQYRWMHIEKLSEFDGTSAFTKAQGQA